MTNITLIPNAFKVFAHSKHAQKLQVVQNRFLLKLGSPWCISNKDFNRDLNLESIGHFIEHASSGIINWL